MQGNCRAKVSDVPPEGFRARVRAHLRRMSRRERTRREVDAWMVLIHDVPEASSSLLPRRKSACVVYFSLCGDALLDAGAAR